MSAKKIRHSVSQRFIAFCLLVTLVLPALTACAPPPQDPVTGVMCDWVDYVHAIGMSLGTIALFISFMIVVISYAGAGVVWAGLYHLSQKLVNGAIVAIILLIIGLPAFWWLVESAGGTVCS